MILKILITAIKDTARMELVHRSLYKASRAVMSKRKDMKRIDDLARLLLVWYMELGFTLNEIETMINKPNATSEPRAENKGEYDE